MLSPEQLPVWSKYSVFLRDNVKRQRDGDHREGFTFLVTLEGNFKWETIHIPHVNGKQAPACIVANAQQRSSGVSSFFLLGIITLSAIKWEDVHPMAFQHMIHSHQHRVC